MLRPRLLEEDGEDLPALEYPGTTLITGGTGDLGRLIARHLAAEHGAEHLLLASRSGGEPEAIAELRNELAETGAELAVVTCDLTDPEEVEGLIAGIPADRPLRSVIHAAGLLEDRVVEGLTHEQLDRVLAPKVDAAWHLHQATEGLSLERFVLFSSVAATLGGAGQGNYAAANAFLDALAAYRRSAGLPASSLAWGLWDQEEGMGGTLGEGERARLARSGIGRIDPGSGLRLYDGATAMDRALLLPLQLEKRALRALSRAGELRRRSPSWRRRLQPIPPGPGSPTGSLRAPLPSIAAWRSTSCAARWQHCSGTRRAPRSTRSRISRHSASTR